MGLTEADVAEASVSEADINEASVSEADITEASVSEADIVEASVSEADVNEASVSEADIIAASVSVPVASVSGAAPERDARMFIGSREAFYAMTRALAGRETRNSAPDGFSIYPIFEKEGLRAPVLFGAACVCGDTSYYFETEQAAALRAQHASAHAGECADAHAGEDTGVLYPAPPRDVFDAFRPVFADPAIKIYGHDIKQICHWLLAGGEDCPVFGFDTMLGAYVVDAASGEYNLSGIYAELTGESLITVDEMRGKGKARKSLQEFPERELGCAAIKCARAIQKLCPILMNVISDNGQEDLYYNVELPLSEVLASMEVKGFMVDVEGIRAFSAELDSYVGELTNRIYELAGETFNINSTKQLGVILYEKLGLKPVKKTKTGYSTDADALLDLSGKHALVDLITEYRRHVKLRSTYTDALIDLISPEDGRIHTTLNQAVTATGRISSADPNLQNIPVRLALGREIRRLFVPEGDGVFLLGADYSQIELRVLAHLSEDEGLAEAFRLGADIHRSTASRVFNVPESDVTDEMRTRAKAVNFGIVYGIGDFSLARDIGVSRAEARDYIEGYLAQYGGVKRYMNDAVEQGRRDGYAATLLHRRRSLPELAAKNFNTRSFGERVAVNSPVQGSAADIIKIAMVRAYKAFKQNKLKSALILQVHDELIAEVYADELTRAAAILRESMENALSLSVPLIADVYYGKNWKDIKSNKI